MKKEIGDLVVLKLSQDEIEYELANMEDLRNILLMKMQSEQDRKELKRTFDVAITAMQMVWLNFGGEEITTNEH